VKVSVSKVLHFGHEATNSLAATSAVVGRTSFNVTDFVFVTPITMHHLPTKILNNKNSIVRVA
jgi:hypothetical protein